MNQSVTVEALFIKLCAKPFDPNDPSIIWLGTGENVGGRHVGIGHGVYMSENGGKKWKESHFLEKEDFI